MAKEELNLLAELEEAVYEKLTQLSFMVKDMPLLVAYLMAFAAKLHIAMGGNKTKFVKLSKEVFDNLAPKKEEITADFKEFIENNTEDQPMENFSKKDLN